MRGGYRAHVKIHMFELERFWVEDEFVYSVKVDLINMILHTSLFV